MGADSSIGWTHHTFNPWTGCAKVSPGCTNCYAEVQDHRFGGANWGPKAPRQLRAEPYWNGPDRWARAARELGERHRVFCGSMCDWAEDRLDLIEPRRRLFGVVRDTVPSLDWLLLTKRPEDAARFLPWRLGTTVLLTDAPLIGDPDPVTPLWGRPWPGVWVGATVEDRQRARERLPVLREIPAVVRFLSCEPLLEPLGNALDLTGIDWVIAGCESGPGRRLAPPTWFRDIRDRCAAAGVPFFLKQATEVWGGVGREFGGEAYRPIVLHGKGSRSRKDGVIEAPYLDGRQHLEFPTPRAVS